MAIRRPPGRPDPQRKAIEATPLDDDLPPSPAASLAAIDPDRSIDPGVLLEIFGQAPIVFNRIYIDITGSVSAALWLAYAIYHVCEREPTPGSWFKKSQQDWLLETGLSRREQESARERLCAIGLLEEQRSPNAPMAYRLVLEQLYALMEHHSARIKAQYLAARSSPDR